ncbi:MAG: hypothetical protein WDO70_08200 [Alphaproteobacteria bacterium]
MAKNGIARVSVSILMVYAIAMAWLIGVRFDIRIAFWMWATGPQILLCLCAIFLRTRLACLAMLSFQGVFFALSLYLYYDVLYIHPDPQSGLAFIFLPLYQYAGIAIVGVVAKIADMIILRRKRQSEKIA